MLPPLVVGAIGLALWAFGGNDESKHGNVGDRRRRHRRRKSSGSGSDAGRSGDLSDELAAEHARNGNDLPGGAGGDLDRELHRDQTESPGGELDGSPEGEAEEPEAAPAEGEERPE